MNFSSINISFGNENPTIIIRSYHVGFGTHSLDQKTQFFSFFFSHKQRFNMTRCMNSVVWLLCFPSFSDSKFLDVIFPTLEFSSFFSESGTSKRIME